MPAIHVIGKRHVNAGKTLARGTGMERSGAPGQVQHPRKKGSRGSDPRPLGLTVGESLDRTCGERPRASRIVLSPRVRPIVCAKSSPFDSQRAAAPIGRTIPTMAVSTSMLPDGRWLVPLMTLSYDPLGLR